jgi:hypothetical protein
MGLVWWLMGALGPCLVVNGGVGPCLVVNGVWAVFSIWVVAQLTIVNGSVGLGFLPPQPRDSTPKPPPQQIQSPDLTKLPHSLSAADGLVPCLAPSAAPTSPAAAAAPFPAAAAATFPCSRCCRWRHPAQGVASPLAPPTPGTPQRRHRCSIDALVKHLRRPVRLTAPMRLSA